MIQDEAQVEGHAGKDDTVGRAHPDQRVEHLRRRAGRRGAVAVDDLRAGRKVAAANLLGRGQAYRRRARGGGRPLRCDGGRPLRRDGLAVEGAGLADRADAAESAAVARAR